MLIYRTKCRSRTVTHRKRTFKTIKPLDCCPICREPVQSVPEEVEKPKRARRKSKAVSKRPEASIQAGCEAILKAAGTYYIRIDNAVYRAISRLQGGDKWQAAKSIGGLPDLTLCLPIHGTEFFLGCAVEVKREGGKRRGKQNQIARRMNGQLITDEKQLAELVQRMDRYWRGIK